MISPESFQEKSYRQHSEHFRDYGSGGIKESHAKTWFENDTVDAWRHQSMYQALDPILETDTKAKWLTIGDGRYGKDAQYILGKGCDALASDISDILLKEAKELGHISEYKKENAEALSFPDSEFEYAFCKESYHHFPRPMLALYEMLRVASKGVILIEPNDPFINDTILSILFRNLKTAIRKLLGRSSSKHSFEESGNYVFSISRREIEKVALGLNYKLIAFKGINDVYLAGVEYEKLSENGPLQKKVKQRIRFANVLSKLGFVNYALLAAIIFKMEPTKELLQALTHNGYEITHLPENPYISG